MSNEILVAFHSGSNYDYHFIIKELAKESEGNFECLREDTEKCKTFSIPIEKEVLGIDKDGNESFAIISYKIKLTDSTRFMETSSSNLIDDITEVIHKIKCKDCEFFLEYESFKDNLGKYKCLSCNKDYSNKLMKN